MTTASVTRVLCCRHELTISALAISELWCFTYPLARYTVGHVSQLMGINIFQQLIIRDISNFMPAQDSDLSSGFDRPSTMAMTRLSKCSRSRVRFEKSSKDPV